MSTAGLRLRTFAPTILGAPNPSAHTASLVFCHGFGATASDWQDLHRLPGLDHLKVILPQALVTNISVVGALSSPGPAFRVEDFTPKACVEIAPD